MMYGYGLGWGLWGMLMMVLFWGACIVLFFWLLKSVITPRDNREITAKTILNERYANGSISKTEYESLKKDLSI